MTVSSPRRKGVNRHPCPPTQRTKVRKEESASASTYFRRTLIAITDERTVLLEKASGTTVLHSAPQTSLWLQSTQGASAVPGRYLHTTPMRGERTYSPPRITKESREHFARLS